MPSSQRRLQKENKSIIEAAKAKYKRKRNGLRERVAEQQEELENTTKSKDREIRKLQNSKEKYKTGLSVSEAIAELLKNLLDKDDPYYKKKLDLVDDFTLICKQNPEEAKSYLLWIVTVTSQTKLSATLSTEQLGLLGNDIAEIDILNAVKLSFSLSKKIDLHYLKMLSYFELPFIVIFHLKDVPEDAEEVKEVVCNIKPKRVGEFHFNDESKLIDISEYTTLFGTLRQNLNTTHFYIYNWRIGSRQFAELMSQLKHSEFIGFYNWVLETDEEFSFDKTLDGTTIKDIYFSHSFSTEHSDAKAHPERIANIFNALGEVQDVRNNLQGITIWGIEEEDKAGIKEMLQQSNLTNWKLFIW